MKETVIKIFKSIKLLYIDLFIYYISFFFKNNLKNKLYEYWFNLF
jgi:hypothetical protein